MLMDRDPDVWPGECHRAKVDHSERTVGRPRRAALKSPGSEDSLIVGRDKDLVYQLGWPPEKWYVLVYNLLTRASVMSFQSVSNMVMDLGTVPLKGDIACHRVVDAMDSFVVEMDGHVPFVVFLFILRIGMSHRY